MYAFSYKARDKNPCKDEDGYGPGSQHNVIVTVVADTAEQAEAAVKAIVTRDDYKLNEVEQMAADGHTIRPGSW